MFLRFYRLHHFRPKRVGKGWGQCKNVEYSCPAPDINESVDFYTYLLTYSMEQSSS